MSFIFGLAPMTMIVGTFWCVKYSKISSLILYVTCVTQWQITIGLRPSSVTKWTFLTLLLMTLPPPLALWPHERYRFCQKKRKKEKKNSYHTHTREKKKFIVWKSIKAFIKIVIFMTSMVGFRVLGQDFYFSLLL